MSKNSLIFEQGDIAIANIPFSDGMGSKRRPVLVISKRSDSLLDVVAIKITSTNPNSYYTIAISNNDLDGAKLKLQSFISVNFIVTIQKSIISSKIAKLKPEKLEQIKEKLKTLFDL